jgi:hypothetical protein
MSMTFLEPGRMLDAAKQAALDAVKGYGTLNAYTIGVAVQAAASVLMSASPRPVALPDTASVEVWDVEAVEVTPRLRALESVASAVRVGHGDHDGCEICSALRLLDLAG